MPPLIAYHAVTCGEAGTSGTGAFTPWVTDIPVSLSWDDSGFVPWSGPDLLSAFTHAKDIFLFIDSILAGPPVDWLEIKLSYLCHWFGEVMADFPFLLTRTASSVADLAGFQREVCGVISDCEQARGCERCSFQLLICPRRYEGQTLGMQCMPSPPSSSYQCPLDPNFFAKNITGNY